MTPDLTPFAASRASIASALDQSHSERSGGTTPFFLRVPTQAERFDESIEDMETRKTTPRGHPE